MKLTLSLWAAATTAAAAQQLAFPGAEGMGRFATGGRFGEVFKVTNLADSGAGSLRDAVSQPNRIVVFDVGGVINVESRVVVSKNVYIAGQTAPGDGITVYGDGWSWSNANDAITRYIRIRMGRGGASGKDAITIAEGARMIFDHVSVSWGRDETFSISGTAVNVTVQDTIIAQGLETHSCGGLMQTDGGISLFRNLYVDNNTRNPKVKGVNDFQNNIIYNWGRGGGYIAGDSAGQSYANIINNYYISGPSTSVTAFTRGNQNFHACRKPCPHGDQSFNPLTGRIDVKDNFYDPNTNGELDGSALCESSTCYSDIDFQDSPFNYPGPETLHSPQEALDIVLANAGASIVRDSIDTTLVNEVRSYGLDGSLIANEDEVGGPGVIAGGNAPTDSDGDGIPDEWEKANGLDPNNAMDGMAVAENGYTNLENYINSLV
ncbi:fibronectin [Emericellopsis atlantica]|uniref:Fibronectin n=1 Tax=Emericellopsis atlantica TaxID=2614577 RepID=A0A9P8CLI4_9HYPO|nr:fibronectin [Emericellopsis atlantica]KAG9251669.1 fibronectin [Emericellopsis atlantica]